MRLGEYIDLLKGYDSDTAVPVGLGKPHSWRGVYSELAFEPVGNITIGEMLKAAESALGATYEGHKGGDFTMDEYTKINVENRGTWSDGGAIFKLLLDYMVAQD